MESKSEDPSATKTRRKRCLTLAIGIASLVLIAVALGLGLGLGLRNGSHHHGPTVDLGYAKYQGTYLGKNVSQFLGMRYAQPPTGDLRWRAPVQPKSRQGVQAATKFGPICLGISQDISDEDDEDCLYVNVWSPTNATPDTKLPVMVFIQGGGYTVNANANWNGSKLLETSGNNIVFVNFNYRVGLFGFLAGEQVRQDGDLNVGLLDQRLLLHWVQTHIAQFGGDPNHVVIQGVSAGAGSVAMHLAAFGGRDDGLFVGAIAESTFFPTQPYVSELETQLNAVFDQLSCLDSAKRMGCLRGKSTEELQLANRPLPFTNETGDPLFYWTACIDGDFIQEAPYSLFEQEKFVGVPILFGTCTNEGSEFAPNASTPQEVWSFFQDNYPYLTSLEASNITEIYPQEAALPDHAAWFPSASRAYGEATFICPTIAIVNAALHRNMNATNGTDTAGIWAYRYNVHAQVNTEQGLGVPHVFETTAVFGTGMLPNGAAGDTYDSYNAVMIPIVMNYWLSFVRALDPNVYKDANAPRWESWTGKEQRLVLQMDNSAMEYVEMDQKERCSFWKRIGPSLQQ